MTMVVALGASIKPSVNLVARTNNDTSARDKLMVDSQWDQIESQYSLVLEVQAYFRAMPSRMLAISSHLSVALSI